MALNTMYLVTVSAMLHIRERIIKELESWLEKSRKTQTQRISWSVFWQTDKTEGTQRKEEGCTGFIP